MPKGFFPPYFCEISEFFKDTLKRPSLLCPRFETPATTGAGVRKKTVTTIEVHQIVIVKRTTGAVLAWCTECLKDVEVVPLDQAAHLAAVSLRDLCRQVDADEIHIVDTANGGLVCLDSLLKKKPENFKESS